MISYVSFFFFLDFFLFLLLLLILTLILSTHSFTRASRLVVAVGMLASHYQ